MMIKNTQILITVSIIVFFAVGLCIPQQIFAKQTIGNALGQLGKTAVKTGISDTQLEPLAGRVIKGGLTVIGMLFLILMVYAGMTWMTAQGEEGQIEKAQKTIVAAIIGIMLIVASYAITNLVVDRLVKGNAGPQVPGAEAGKTVGEGPQSCCIDWVSRDPANGSPIPACRVTTKADCQLQGETVNDFDRFACNGPREGCWTFQDNPLLQDQALCAQKCE